MIRKALLEDVNAIHGLLQLYARKEELLARPLSILYDHLRDFWVYQDPETHKIVGCCGLQFCWEDLAEIRSLAVAPGFTSKGIGSTLTERCIQEALYFKVKKLFTLTYRPTFFEQFGFSIIQKSELPIKIWSDCIACPNFPNCDETAMLKMLTPAED